MEFDQDEFTFTTFLGVACRDLKEGRNLHALVIFGPLAKIDFSQQRVARHGEAIATARMGQYQQAYTESEKQLTKLVRDSREETVSKANALMSLAEVKIGLQQFEGIDQILDEAAQIYSNQGLPEYSAAIVHLQGIVALWSGDYEEATEKFTWASTLSEIQIPDVVPTGFGIEASPEPTTMDWERRVASSSRTPALS